MARMKRPFRPFGFQATSFFVALAMSGWMFTGSPAWAKACDEQFYSFESRDALKAKLPRRGSAKYKAMAQKVASDLLKTRSYATLDLTQVFTPELVRAWQLSFPTKFASQLHREAILPSVETTNPQAESRPAYEAQLVATRELQDWLRTLIQDAIVLPPKLRLHEGFAAIRNSTAQEKSLLFGEWHPDGGGVSVTLALKGAGTEVLGGVPIAYAKSGAEIHGKGDKWLSICSDCQAVSVPAGHALILLGDLSLAKGEEVLFTPTIHRTPSYSGERQLFLFRY